MAAGLAWPRLSRGKAPNSQAELAPEAEAVFERLRAWRAAVAQGTGHAGVRDLPRRDPAADRGVAAVDAGRRSRQVNGVGETKLARYGQQLLDVLAEASP